MVQIHLNLKERIASMSYFQQSIFRKGFNFRRGLLQLIDIFHQQCVYFIKCLSNTSQKQSMNRSLANHQSQYLDISELVLKEHSPYFKPHTIQHHEQASQLDGFDLESKQSDDAFLDLDISPLSNRGLDFTNNIVDCLNLFEFSEFSDEEDNRKIYLSKNKKIKKEKHLKHPTFGSYYTQFYYQNDLQNIIEENQFFDFEIFQQNQESYFSDEQADEEICEDLSEIENCQEKEDYQEKVFTQNYHQEETYPLQIQWNVTNPKKQIISKLKAICSNNQDFLSEEAKIDAMKEVVETYTFDHQHFYLHESMNGLNGSVSAIFTILCKGIEQTFKRTIGGLSFEKRRRKLLKYMHKKNRRVWNKKVNYDCRKKVADGRLRIKGKFVTFDQVCEQLGMESLEGYTADEVKEMLEKKS